MNVHVKLWFKCNQELPDIANALKASLDLGEFIHDGEDTWEWCIWDKTEMIYDISRKHHEGKGIFDYPIGVYVNRHTNNHLTEIELEIIGRKISKTLKVKVCMGEVRYVEGNDFEFYAHKYLEEY